jgi:hypothetical protein
MAVRKQERRNSMLNEFKNFNAERMQVDELIALSAYGKALRAEYEAHQVEVPSYVSTQLNALTREIKSRTADALAARRKQIDAQLESLRTPAEKRAALEAEAASLDKQLATA